MRFREEFRRRRGNQVEVPRVFEERTTRKVLVTQWVRGRKLADCSPEVSHPLPPWIVLLTPSLTPPSILDIYTHTHHPTLDINPLPPPHPHVMETLGGARGVGAEDEVVGREGRCFIVRVGEPNMRVWRGSMRSMAG